MSSDHYSEYAGKGFLLASLGLSFIFWLAMTYVLTAFVPAQTPLYKYLWAGYTSLCLTGVFFLATHMFWLVFGESRRRKMDQA